MKKPKKIFINQNAINDPVTKDIINHYPNVPVEVIKEYRDLHHRCKESNPKQILYLTHGKGDVVRACPGTAESYLCCRYQVINQTLNCPLNCSYCILQFYLNQPATTIFTDFDDIFNEVKIKIQAQPDRLIRIGTGELADSLALYGSLNFAKEAVEFFSTTPNVLFELKTKTNNIAPLLNLNHNQHTVLSWSLNPQEIINKEEHSTASLNERLSAAKEAEKAGYLLGFHFDPILHVPNWKSLYTSVIDYLYSSVDPSRIVWISMGSLRFPPSMKDKIVQRYRNSKIVFDEMIRGLDGKLRYPRPLRVPMYRHIYKKLTSIENPPFIYFCMESSDVWDDVMGFHPNNNAHLDYMFAESIHRRFKPLGFTKPKIMTYEKGFNLEDSFSL